MLELRQIVQDFAKGIELADAKAPKSKNWRPGIGPHDEPDVIALVMSEIAARFPARYAAHKREVLYPGTRQACDLCIGEAPDFSWAIEFKALRMLGDKGHTGTGRDDVSKILSPYPQQRSALTDCDKLASLGLGQRQGLIIYAYDCEDYPAESIIEIFEFAANRKVRLGDRLSCPFLGLIHPVHQTGTVYGWELKTP